MKYVRNTCTWELPVNWKTYPGWSKREQEFLRVPLTPTINIYHTLGKIKKKNDGRWEWTVIEDTKDFWFVTAKPLDKTQGVCLTKEEAIQRIEESWGVYEK